MNKLGLTLAILWVAGVFAARIGMAAEGATAREACEALSGLVVSATKIGLPTSGAHIDSGLLRAAPGQTRQGGHGLVRSVL
jgi:hypothetical protein